MGIRGFFGSLIFLFKPALPTISHFPLITKGWSFGELDCFSWVLPTGSKNIKRTGQVKYWKFSPWRWEWTTDIHHHCSYPPRQKSWDQLFSPFPLTTSFPTQWQAALTSQLPPPLESPSLDDYLVSMEPYLQRGGLNPGLRSGEGVPFKIPSIFTIPYPSAPEGVGVFSHCSFCTTQSHLVPFYIVVHLFTSCSS